MFPSLVGRGLLGWPAEGYWVDIGTPDRYLEATYDLLGGHPASGLPARDETSSLIGEGCLTAGAHIGPQTVLGAHCSVGSDTAVERSVLHDGVLVGPDCVIRESVLAEARARGRGRPRGAGRAGGRRRAGRGRRASRGRRAGRAGGDGRMTAIDPGSIERLDPAGMLADIVAQPLQLEDALWRAESAALPAAETPGGLLVCGMGGSAIGADLANAVLGDRATRPLHVLRGYSPPGWLTSDYFVLCSSYSGETEETLACYEAARISDAPRAVLTTGGSLAEMAREDGVPVIGIPSGMQPRAAVIYMVVGAMAAAAACDAAPSLRGRGRAGRAAAAKAGRRVGPRRERLAGRRGGRPAERHGPRGARLRSHAGAGHALEDADQRERRDRRVRLGAARGQPQRDLRLGARPRRWRRCPRCSSRAPTSTRVCAAAWS